MPGRNDPGMRISCSKAAVCCCRFAETAIPFQGDHVGTLCKVILGGRGLDLNKVVKASKGLYDGTAIRRRKMLDYSAMEKKPDTTTFIKHQEFMGPPVFPPYTTTRKVPPSL